MTESLSLMWSWYGHFDFDKVTLFYKQRKTEVMPSGGQSNDGVWAKESVTFHKGNSDFRLRKLQEPEKPQKTGTQGYSNHR